MTLENLGVSCCSHKMHHLQYLLWLFLSLHIFPFQSFFDFSRIYSFQFVCTFTAFQHGKSSNLRPCHAMITISLRDEIIDKEHMQRKHPLMHQSKWSNGRFVIYVCFVLPFGKLTCQWKSACSNRKYIFKWWIFHCYVRLPECTCLLSISQVGSSFLDYQGLVIVDPEAENQKLTNHPRKGNHSW